LTHTNGELGRASRAARLFRKYDADYWAGKHAKIEQAAVAADPAQA
jgi:iron-sulfur cluster repair protein YtfE (RIC family)